MQSKLSFIPVLFLAIFSLSSCDKNANNNTSNNTPAAGTWKVSYFFDKLDETSHYTTYTFEFGANGALSATNGSQTWSGTWTTGIDDSANKFQIDFSNTNSSLPSELEDLEEDWGIVVMQNDLMHFEHTSGGNGDTDVLKFTK